VRSAYKQEEVAFHSSDVKPEAHARRQEMKLKRRPPVLGAKARREWNADTSVPAKCERAAATLMAHDRRNGTYNYRAEVLPPKVAATCDAFGRVTSSALRQTLRASELPVNPALEGKASWDDRTMVGDGERARARLTADADTRARRATAKARAALSGYVGPMERERQRMRLLRAQRADAATRALEADAEFGGVGADAAAIRAMEAAGLTVFSDAETPGQTAHGVRAPRPA